MTDSYGIWEIDETTNTSKRLEETDWASTEDRIEDAIVRAPDMVMPGLKLVGRQLQTESGVLDLLGVDTVGRLIVIEIKRKQLTRDAVAQAVDYASWLDSLDVGELQRRICENSGQRGIERIDNFEQWYDKNDNWVSLEDLMPVRIVLVGLGEDVKARRMADWLARKGVAIDLLTFKGYRDGKRMLLARQLDSGDEVWKLERRQQSSGRRAKNQESWRKLIEDQVDEYGMRDWWGEAVAMLQRDSRTSYRANTGITFYKERKLTLSTGVGAAGCYKIQVEKNESIRITFFPVAVDLCLENFKKSTLQFERVPPPNAPVTERAVEQWSCLLNKAEWGERKNSIGELVRMVDEQWRKAVE